MTANTTKLIDARIKNARGAMPTARHGHESSTDAWPLQAVAMAPSRVLGARLNRRRRGIVLVAVIVLIAVSLTLFGLWTRSVVRERERFALHQYRQQAEQLAQAGARRAIARRAAESSFAEETWTVPAENFDKLHSGKVQIRVAPSADNSRLRYEAIAEYPAGALRRAQITRTIELPNPPSAKKP